MRVEHAKDCYFLKCYFRKVSKLVTAAAYKQKAALQYCIQTFMHRLMLAIIIIICNIGLFVRPTLYGIFLFGKLELGYAYRLVYKLCVFE